MALDARLNTALLSEPYWPHLQAQTIATYVSLLLYAVMHETDGHIDGEYVVGRFPLPHVTDDALNELEAVGLLKFDKGSVQLDWTHQTTREELNAKREYARERQARWRERERRKQQSEPNADVTRYERVTNAQVGKARTGQERQGQEQGQEEEAAVLGESNHSQPEAGYDAWANVPIAQPGSGTNY